MAITEYGLQMYSLRDITKDSMRMALEKVAEMGYKYVEFAGFYDYTAEQIKIWLDAFGLKASGTHTGLAALTDENFADTVKYHKTIGCTNLIVPWADWSTEEKYAENIASLNAAQKKLACEGIKLGYHNHSQEFLPTPYGKIIEDELFANTSLELEVDTFWSFNAGRNNIEVLEKLKDRISVIHLKDGIPAAESDRTFSTCHNGVKGVSVGSGKAPVRDVVAWAKANNVRMVIESEGLDPDGLGETGRCIEFLKSID